MDNTYEANFIKEELEEHGIRCILTNENITSLLPYMNGILGSGVQVLVDKDDLDLARDILDKRKKSDIIACPDCGSKNIKYGLGTKSRPKKILALIIAIVLASPTKHIRQTYYCQDCKREFQE